MPGTEKIRNKKTNKASFKIGYIAEQRVLKRRNKTKKT